MLIFEIVLALFCVARPSLGIAGITYVVNITYIGFKSKRGLILKKRKEGKQSISLRYEFTNIHTPCTMIKNLIALLGYPVLIRGTPTDGFILLFFFFICFNYSIVKI